MNDTPATPAPPRAPVPPSSPSAAGVERAVAAQRTPSIASPAADALLMGGASLLLLPLLAATSETASEESARAIAALFAITIGWPHVAASVTRTYASRNAMSRRPLTAFGLPALVVAALVAVSVAPDVAGPPLVKALLLSVPLHIARQGLGIAALYAKWLATSLMPWEWALLRACAYGSAAAYALRAESATSLGVYEGILHAPLGLPPILAGIADGVALALTGALALRAALRSPAIPAQVWAPVLAVPAWLVLGRLVPTYALLVPGFHALQALTLAWAADVAAPAPTYAPRRPTRGWRTPHWLALQVVGGAALFQGLPWLLLVVGTPQGVAVGLAAVAVQLHHMVIDPAALDLADPESAASRVAQLGARQAHGDGKEAS